MIMFIDQNYERKKHDGFDWRRTYYATLEDFSMLADMPVGHADARHPVALLRARSERQGDCGATKRSEKFASPHTNSRA
jgi:hypothetical protein